MPEPVRRKELELVTSPIRKEQYEPGSDGETGFTARELAVEDPEAVRYLKQELQSGKKWHVALLEAMGMWTLPDEEFQGRQFTYLVQGEAFDWLVLAERLCCSVDGLVPAQEKEQLLFHGNLPSEIIAREFQELLGFSKYRGFLNYWYGVIVEEALQLKVEEEVRKQHRARAYPDSENLVEEAFIRIYEDTRISLLNKFLEKKGPKSPASLSLTDIKEFTYWLFKRRVKIWDPARVASDTRKGLEKLHSLRKTDTFLGS